ncbi:MAG: DUF6134 family protein [Endozoicomonas sp. (ex Botrylloides leachii)]|nr:DUF6134 family protein [Endozoicomonas sp. (ex Botrylloides leachii)]
MRYLTAYLCLTLLSSQVLAKDWDQLYGTEITFDVYRNDHYVGSSVTKFERQQKGWLIKSVMNLKVPILFLLSYKYFYQSNEYWRNDLLQQLDVEEDRNGEIKKINVRTNEESSLLKGQTPLGKVEIKLPILTSNHYNSDVINSDRLLNTLTGAENQYTLVFKGKEKIATNKGVIEANRYRYNGDLKDTEVWYSQSGHWVKLWFKGDDGSNIELRCVYCIK